MKFEKVMFLQVSVCPQGGGMHGRGACIAGGMHSRGACMAGWHVWQWDIHGRGVCMAGGVHGRGARVTDTTRYGQ